MTDAPPREWNATDYHRLANPHVTWGRRVLARLPLRGDETVLDAGCGTGRLTAELLEHLPYGRVIAVDLSANMLREARQHLEPIAGDRVTYVQADLQTLTLDEPVDAIFSTAALHWVLDHNLLFQHLYACLKPGGWLVAQCGGGPNIAGLIERATDLMRSDEYRPYFDGWSGPWEFASEATTAERLAAAGFVEISTSLEEAPVTLADHAEYRDYLETVVFGTHLSRIPDPALRQRFVETLAERAASDDPPFLLDYWRLNMQARRPAE
jgi:trans-aconitate methyltransferase